MRTSAASFVLAAALAALPPSVAAAQEGAQGAQAQETHYRPGPGKPNPRPAGWAIRYDRADAVDSTFYFVDMPPGWHITTGPAAIMYERGATASGDFALESELYLFPGRRAEGFGVFVGGADLEGEGQRYTYFLLRRTGEFLVKKRDGAATRELVPWTAHPAIPKHESEEGAVKYVVGVTAAADSVSFTVNGERVATLPRAAVAPDGAYGMRVNHMVELHVTSLRAAPR